MRALRLAALAAVAAASASAQPQAIVAAAADHVEGHYVFPDRGTEIADHLRARIEAGAYPDGLGPDSLVDRLTRDLRAVNGDKHLKVEHLDADAADDAAWLNDAVERGRTTNHGFTEARVLDGNVGLLRVEQFADPRRARPALERGLAFLDPTEAMIVDLRGCPGGHGQLMHLLLSRFFESPEPLATVETAVGTVHELRTPPDAPGRSRVGEPLFVLVDEDTGSAAEFFTYTLQANGAATVVGETSSGAAHMIRIFDLPSTAGRYRVHVSVARPVVAATGTNWEGVGVHPDVAVAPTEAPAVAHRLAVEALLDRASGAARDRLAAALAALAE